MRTLYKYEPNDFLHPLCEIFYHSFYFSPAFYFLLSTLYFRLYLKLLNKHFNIQNKSTPDF